MDRDEEKRIEEQEIREVYEQRVSDFKHTFEAGPGKRVYKYVSEWCFENKSTFDASSQSTCSFNEGSRFVILEIRKWLDATSTDIEIMVQNTIKRKGARL